MTDEVRSHTVEVLNRLYAAEKRSLLPRLGEMHPFVSRTLADELEQVHRMIAEEARHETWLIDALEDSGGGLWPAAADIHTASLHYLDLQTLMPRVLAGVEQLYRLYTQAQADKHPLAPKAAQVIARIAESHQLHLDQLRNLHQPMSTTL